MVFSEQDLSSEPASEPTGEPPAEGGDEPRKSGRPQLKVVK